MPTQGVAAYIIGLLQEALSKNLQCSMMPETFLSS